MAKYGRHDPRNKKKRKHKMQSIDKDLRIRHVDEEYEKWPNDKWLNYDWDEDEFEESA